MERVDTLQKEKRVLSRAEFEKKYAHHWLICELDDDARQALFRTIVSSTRRSSAARRVRAGSMAEGLVAEPGRYGLYPVLKTGANPWSDRILVGRASNNDIVLKNDRISKLHAYFQQARGGLHLHDAKSANGTRVDGTLIPPGEDGVDVKSGQVLAFGTLTCELISTADLYDAL